MGGERRKPKDAHLLLASEFLSLVLRHEPERIGIRLDPGGWTDLAELLARAPIAGVLLSEELIEQVVAGGGGRSFARSEDGRRIRAISGHTVPVVAGLEGGTPPELLYHAVAHGSLDEIRANGLRAEPGGQLALHADADAAAAAAAAPGSGEGRSQVVEVESGRMSRGGHSFLRSEDGVWLVDRVPAEFLRST